MKDIEIKNGTVYIESVADLSPQELKELQTHENITHVAISGKYNNNGNETPYSVKEYKKIYSKLQEYTEGINPEWSKDKKFTYIFRRVSMGIDYDHIAGYPKKDSKIQEIYSHKNIDDCRNLKNGLLNGKCVCAGYAEILRHACSLKDIDCRYVQGPTTDGGNHAWNIVEIEDGTWIEVDPTWSHANGVEYIGDDKKRFWKEHGESEYKDNTISYLHSRYFDFPLISNFNLNKFINSELGIEDDRKYTKSEQAKFIELLENRDVRGIDITEDILQVFKKRDEFEQKVGYTVEQLVDIGIDFNLISTIMENNFDTKTGEKINKRAQIESLVEQQIKTTKEFESEVGYTKEELKNMGFSSKQIESIIEYNYDGQTGKKFDKKFIVELQLNQIAHMPIEMKIIENMSKGMIHPKVVDKLLYSVKNGDLSIEEVIKIIDANKNNLDSPEVRQIKDRLDSREKVHREKIEEQFDKEFEEEVGYTIEQIKNMGFTDEKIKKMKMKFNNKTGERIDRKQIVEAEIKNRKRLPKIMLKKLYEKLFLTRKDMKESVNILKETHKELIMNDIEQDADKEEIR